MIKVLKHGKIERTVTCPNCKALLSYIRSDIQWKVRVADDLNPYSMYYRCIECPDCGEDIIMKLENG